MVNLSRILCCLALLIACVFVHAEPPGDLTVKTISFVADINTDLAKPIADSQAAMLAAVIRDENKESDARVSKDGRVLFVTVAKSSKLFGADVQHFSDCAINSQFQFKENPKLVKSPPAPDQDEEYVFDYEGILATNRKYADVQGVKQLLTTWTMLRHAAPANIGYKYSVYGNVDVTLDHKQLTAHREAVKQRQLIAGN